MDPLTHALSGAVAGQAFVPDADSPRGCSARAALLLGAVFPDSDVFLNPFEPHGLGTIRFHRGLTHSVVCLPLFAALLAAAVVRVCRWRRIECPSWLRLSVLLGAGLALHIGFDAITSFGTMMWSPLDWTRVSWDTTFIIDPLLTALLLLPLLLGWIYYRREAAIRRAVALWTALSIVALGVVWAARLFESAAAAAQGASPQPAPDLLSALRITGIVSALLACVLGLPAVRGKGFRFTRRTWSRAGTAAVVVYLLASTTAHSIALRRVERFALAQGLRVERIAALPMPPSILFWSGLVRTTDKIYYSYFGLWDSGDPAFRQHQQSPLDVPIERALALPDVQIAMRFFRFPLIVRSERSGGLSEVDFFDLRFLPARRGSLSFAYRVRIDGATGRTLGSGWILPQQK